jgi:pimeloyl-ACP methyl ester carboxylesterase/class 3 adenylate cyclase
VQAETNYAHSGNVSVAYQVVGAGPFDLVYVPGFVSNLEYEWNDPGCAGFMARLSSFSRLIRFDKRGTGLSDRATDVPTLENRMDDVRAVMDSVGSERAAIFGVSEGGPMAALFAATYPERTFALVLYGAWARELWAMDYPWGRQREELERRAYALNHEFGTPAYVERVLNGIAPSVLEDRERVAFWSSYMRMSASPGAASALARMNMDIDVRPVLSAIRVPTLALAREGDLPLEGNRDMAERIPGARYVEVPGIDHVPWVGDWEPIAAAVESFVKDAWHARAWEDAESDRVLTTVLFTDIAGSTAKAAELGDARWRELLGDHHALIRRQLARFRGRELDTAGDGFFASFDGPARAVRCACAITASVKELGIDIRAGLHTGECELHDGKLAGIAISIGSRVAAEAQPGEVLVSSTVKDLVAGAGIDFEDRGIRALKGVPGQWRVYAVRI